MSISILNKTRQPVPRIRFDFIKDKVLGKQYELSLVLVGPTVSRRINKSLRGKDYATNVLSFELSENSGEIFLDLSTIRKQEKKFGMNYKKLVAFLFIHGLLHLKGMEHSDKMSEAEKKILNVASNRSWY